MAKQHASTTSGIHGWPATERPRERLLRQGPEALSDAQLLAILLRIGRPDSSAVQVAMDLLHQLGGLQGLSNRGLEELYTVSGIGPAKVAHIKAAIERRLIELGKRVLSAPLTMGTRIGASHDLFRHYYPLLRDLRHEVFKTILLDAKHCIIRDITVSEGSLTLSIVHPREVFNQAVRESAATVIFLHNHPSGDPQPSSEDRALTARLASAGEILGNRVLDHLIVGDGTYVSFADNEVVTGIKKVKRGMLKKSASGVLGPLSCSRTPWTFRVPPVLRPCWTAFLNIPHDRLAFLCAVRM